MQTFFPTGDSLSFPLLAVSFTELKFLIMMKFNLSMIYFINYAFGVISKNSLPNSQPLKFSLLVFFLLKIFG